MITKMNANRFATHSLTDPRILRILSSALMAVDPAVAVKNHLPRLQGNVNGLGIGKASIPMLMALAEAIPLSSALAISKHASSHDPGLFPVLLGGHPVPDLRSLEAGQRVLDFVSVLHEDDTLVCLISGGGSALMTVPYEGISLEDMQSLTSLLLACGTPIDDINILRRQLDRLKGGGLARATKARVISLILSDVIGNPMEAIASGPTCPNPTTREDAFSVLKKYGVEEQVPVSIQNYLIGASTFAKHPHESMLAPQQDGWSDRVQNIIIGDNKLAAKAALEQARREGFNAEILTNELQGEAREVGVMLAKRLSYEITKRKRPFCLIAGGETTVTLRHSPGQALKGDSKGGRNQELALTAMDGLKGIEDVMLISLATDGEDGPTDAAGAVVTGVSAQRAELFRVDAADYLSRNDAYHFFEKMDDLIRTGPSGTNVNDLIFLFAV
jgi:hydroxypyruvate reductase